MPVRTSILWRISISRGLATVALVLSTLFSAFPLSAGAYSGPPVPDPTDLITLVRDTMLAVDAGNKTGDYAQLHAMGSDAFRNAQPPSSLATGFADLRASQIDLSVVRTKVPLTTRPPTMDRNGRLRILGYYELPGTQVVYDFLYDYAVQPGRWELASISVKPRVLPPQPQLMQPE